MSQHRFLGRAQVRRLERRRRRLLPPRRRHPRCAAAGRAGRGAVRLPRRHRRAAELVALAERQDDGYRGELAALRARHATIAETLLDGRVGAQLYLAGFDRDCHDIEGILHTVELTRSAAQQRQRPDRRLRRDLVDAGCSIASSKSAGSRPGAVQWIDARAGAWSSSGARWARQCSGTSRAPSCAQLVPRGLRRHADHHRLHRLATGAACRPRSAATAATSPARSSARCSTPREIHIWTDVDGVLSRRSAPRARRHGHRLALVQRGDGARVLRRQGHPSADHGAGGRPRHPDLDPQHLRAREAGHADLRAAGTRALPVKGITSIEQRRAGQPRGRRHDRRAGHGASPVRRAARGGHLGHPDLAGQLRALDLLRDSAGRRPSAPRAWCATRSSAS